MVELLRRTVDACVLIKEGEIRSMYEWGEELNAALDTLARNGFVARDGSNLISSSALVQN